MKPAPLIGITTDHNSRPSVGDSRGAAAHTQFVLPHSYAQAVEAAGGVPVLLPYRAGSESIARYVEICDGFVFSGGDDYDPHAYGEEIHPNAVLLDPAREAFDRALIAAVEARRKPVLGICGGCQLMNLHRGGSLHQFIPDLRLNPSIEHRRFSIEEWQTKRHDVVIDRDSKLGGIVGSTALSSNSSHKQSVRDLGTLLRIVARAPDGIVEAIEDASLPFFVGVQWHPERQHEEAVQLKLFEALVRASGSSGSGT